MVCMSATSSKGSVGSQFIFLICPKKLPTPLVSLTTNHRRILQQDIVFIFGQLQFGFASVFTTESVKTPLSLLRLSSSFIDFAERHLIIGLSHYCKRFFQTYTLTLIAHLDLFGY
jgi:hypothetical protein